MLYAQDIQKNEEKAYHSHFWEYPGEISLLIRPFDVLSAPSVASSSTLQSLVFTSNAGSGYAHLDHHLYSTPESIEHRQMRARKAKLDQLEEFSFVGRSAQELSAVWTEMPRYLYSSAIKVMSYLRCS